MTEKELLQKKHREEEAAVREKIRQRKARTRRLIQEGAVLESVFPQAEHLEPETLKEVLKHRLG